MKRFLTFVSLFVSIPALYAQSCDTGKKFFYYQKYASAENFFHQYLKANPNDDEGWLWLIKSYLQQNKAGKAADTFSLAPVSISDRPDYLIAKGTLSLVRNKKDSASYYFKKAMEVSKSKNSSVPGLVAEAQLSSEHGDITYAIEVVTKALKKNKNDPWLYATLGRCYRQLHDGSNAYQAFTTAAQKDENYAAAFFELGKIFQTQKNTEMYLSFFTKAITADKNYVPAYYELYYHYLYTNPSQAMTYFNSYSMLADKSPQHDYSYTDLLYLTKNYTEAITNARRLLQQDTALPRLYKLVAYSYAELQDTIQALSFMEKYFAKGHDSIFIAKDFETAATLYASSSIDRKDSAITYYQKAISATTDSSMLYDYYAELASLSKSIRDYDAQAGWLGLYYRGNEKASNIDLFNWGIAAYRSGNFTLADTAFATYTEKYPEQGFGYYWRARSNAAIDTTMETGLAIPHYRKLTEILNIDSLSATDKKWITEAYSYLAAYETNTLKNYDQAVGYFEKILVVDPENETAKKYIDILEKTIGKKEDTN